MRKDVKDYIETMKINGRNRVVLADIARQFDCDYRTVQKHYNERDQEQKKSDSIKVVLLVSYTKNINNHNYNIYTIYTQTY